MSTRVLCLSTVLALVVATAPAISAAPPHGPLDSPSTLSLTAEEDGRITLAYDNRSSHELECRIEVTDAEWVAGLEQALQEAADPGPAIGVYRAANPLPTRPHLFVLGGIESGDGRSSIWPYDGPRPAGAFSVCRRADIYHEIEFALPPESTGSLDLGSLTGSLESGSLASLGTGTTSGS
ncbi:MAG TPA: hypothetical protein GX694_01960 [Actinomycetales bacterium]|nr:hypothetical protein [Actinomycetales bacterium]